MRNLVAQMTVTSRPAVRFRLLDPLRGLAALWVFTFHYEFSEAFRRVFRLLMPVLKAGQLGVPMFFVISGYCLMASIKTAHRNRESVGSFLFRRTVRIYPPYWCSLVVIVALPFIIEGLSALKTGTFVRPTAENINYGFLNYGIGEWIRVLTLTQIFTPMAAATTLQFKFTTINAVVWTLAIEFQFYLVMTVALALRGRWAVFLTAVTAVSVPFWYTGVWSLTGIFLPYWPMFAIGIALYLIVEHGLSYAVLTRRTGVTGPLLGLGAMIGVFVILTLWDRKMGDIAFALGFGLALWLLHALDQRFRDAERHGSQPLRVALGGLTKLGWMSYSLYLLHGRLQFLALLVCRQLFSSGIAFDVIAISLTCAMCYIFFSYCERPFIQSRTGGPPGPSTVGPGGALVQPVSSP